MRLVKNSIAYKSCSVLRLAFAKMVHGRRLELGGVGMLGESCYVFVSPRGTLKLGRKAILGDHTELQADGSLTIGDNFVINRYSRVVAFESIRLGNNVTIAQHVAIVDHDHNYTMEGDRLLLKGYSTSPIVIGDNVWLADKCTVLRGVTIGSNVVAGANTLINKDVPSNCVIGGVPFKILKELR